MCFSKDKSQEKWVVLVGGMHHFLTNVVLREMKETTYNLLILDKEETLNLVSPSCISINVELMAIDYEQHNICSRIHEITQEKHIIRFMTFRELATHATAKLNESLHLGWTTPAAISLIRNKFIYNEALARGGVPVAQAKRVKSESDLKKALRQEPFSTRGILKPVTGLGSVDVFELPLHQEEALESMRNMENKVEYILEEFLEGRQFSVDGICYESEYVELAVCEKHMFKDTFVACRQSIGVKLGTVVRAKLDELVPKLLQEVGISHGFYHLQFWVKEDEIIFGEIHNRPGGSFIGPASSIHSGVRPFRALISRQDFEEETEQLRKQEEREFVAIEILKYPRSGVLYSAERPDHLINSNQVVLVHFYDNFGKRVTSDVKTTFDYAGLVVTKGATIFECTDLARRIKNGIKFSIR